MTIHVERFRLELVDQIPDELEEGALYLSMRHATVIHLCACGCGLEVVTALDPTDYKLIFDGESITLRPSIGNWRFECRSHYFITNSRVQWLGEMTDRQISADPTRNRRSKELAFEHQDHDLVTEPVPEEGGGTSGGVFKALRRLFSR